MRIFHVVLLYVALLGATQLSAAPNPAFAAGVSWGNVNTYSIWEASGLLVSRQNPGVLWTHNDSGYPGSIFALSTNGIFLGHWSIPGVSFGDFEDISFGPGPNPAYEYIYLGDIGDNYLVRANISVYRFPEPAVYLAQSNAPVEGIIPKWDQITLSYPDGVYNAEAMVVDPRTGDLFIFTKLDLSSRVYKATRAQMDAGGAVTLSFMVEITFRKPSAADISRDGSLIALRRGGSGAVWVRGSGQTVDQAVNGKAITIPLAVEPNGEAIAFTPDLDAYFTLSEQYLQPLYYYERTDTTPPHPRVFVGAGATWLYDDSGSASEPGWTLPGFDDSYFVSGPAPIGYASGEATTINYGAEYDKVITTYLRHSFAVGSLTGLTNLALRLCYNDGAAVYLNGQEVMRRKLAPNARADTLASASNNDFRSFWTSVAVRPALLHAGTNVLAVEIHRADRDGPSLNFDLRLEEMLTPATLAPGTEILPRFTTVPRLADGLCTLHVTGVTNSVVQVFTSTDLISWTMAGTVSLPDGQGDFQQPASGDAVFFKVRDW